MQRLPRFIAGCAAAAHEHEVPRAAFDQPFGRCNAESTETAGSKIRGVCQQLEPAIHRSTVEDDIGLLEGQDDLSDVLCLGEVAKRVGGTRNGKRGDWQRLECARLE